MFTSEANPSNRFHWMPRKNPNDVNSVLMGIYRSKLPIVEGWQGEPLDRLSHVQVADKLNGAKLFLSFGHPEGFGLPIAEAMAAGCWVVGYSGMGEESFSDTALLRKFPWRLGSFYRGVPSCPHSLHRQPRDCIADRETISAIKSLFNVNQELNSISRAWNYISAQFSEWSCFSVHLFKNMKILFVHQGFRVNNTGLTYSRSKVVINLLVWV